MPHNLLALGDRRRGGMRGRLQDGFQPTSTGATGLVLLLIVGRSEPLVFPARNHPNQVSVRRDAISATIVPIARHDVKPGDSIPAA